MVVLPGAVIQSPGNVFGIQESSLNKNSRLKKEYGKGKIITKNFMHSIEERGNNLYFKSSWGASSGTE